MFLMLQINRFGVYFLFNNNNKGIIVWVFKKNKTTLLLQKLNEINNPWQSKEAIALNWIQSILTFTVLEAILDSVNVMEKTYSSSWLTELCIWGLNDDKSMI